MDGSTNFERPLFYQVRFLCRKHEGDKNYLHPYSSYG
jgi:hypothetical protein